MNQQPLDVLALWLALTKRSLELQYIFECESDVSDISTTSFILTQKESVNEPLYILKRQIKTKYPGINESLFDKAIHDFWNDLAVGLRQISEKINLGMEI